MLTDIFATRYAERAIWRKFGEPERRLLVQSFRILKEQVCPYYNAEGNERSQAKAFWKDIHDRVSMELGLSALGPLAYAYQTTWNGKPFTHAGTHTIIEVCETWMLKEFDDGGDPDSFIKKRLSLIELGFRKREEQINARDANTDAELWNKFVIQAFKAYVDELNTRFQQAGCKLHYHNGFMQFGVDGLITAQIEAPFWSVVADPKWANVDIDMKEAIDRRDTGGRDPAWYAARALESTIKIISNEKKWTHGGEKGAHNFIDNLASKKAAFLAPWEAENLKSYFTNVRNPFGHGPGEQPMPALSADQTNWAIETAMAWVKALVLRSSI